MEENIKSISQESQLITQIITEAPRMAEKIVEQVSKTSKSNIPANDTDILAVLECLLPKWNEVLMPIVWMQKSRMQQLYVDYRYLSFNRRSTGASRGSLTEQLNNIDDEIDEAIEFVKNRVAERMKSKSSAVASYKELGIIKGRKYTLPEGREDRLAALEMLVKALAEYNFQDTEYGIEYWNDVRSRYDALLKQTRINDGTVSLNVGTLNEMRAEIKKFNGCFISIVKGNYPETWKAQLRYFGFQKEKY